MPKKPGARPPRANLIPGRETRPARRPARSGPAIPIGSTVPVVEPIAAPPPRAEFAPAATARPRLAASRTYRPPRSSIAPLITDYRYVLTDLRRIGVLAGVAFAVLLALTFVIH
jgi:hypothetical protein